LQLLLIFLASRIHSWLSPFCPLHIFSLYIGECAVPESSHMLMETRKYKQFLNGFIQGLEKFSSKLFTPDFT